VASGGKAQQQQQQQPVKLTIVPAPTAGAPRGYANNLRVTFTAEDFTLFFGCYSTPPMDAPPKSGEIKAQVEPVMNVTIPLNILRSVIAVLQRQLDSYEENFGAIPAHPSQPSWMVENNVETTAEAEEPVDG
jgi:hypothetical protein